MTGCGGVEEDLRLMYWQEAIVDPTILGLKLADNNVEVVGRV